MAHDFRFLGKEKKDKKDKKEKKKSPSGKPNEGMQYLSYIQNENVSTRLGSMSRHMSSLLMPTIISVRANCQALKPLL